MEILPAALERFGDAGLRIDWTDGSRSEYSAADLRDACPCATCREKKSAEPEEAESKSFALPVLSMAEAQPIQIERMRPVGNYAYNIAFSDGHDSGIFTFEFLYQLESQSE